MLNQRALAKHLGLTQATVSRALRGDASKKTLARVRQAAEKFGYRENPLVSAVMEQIRSGRPITEQGCIAILVDAESASEWPVNETYKLQYEGMVQRAAQHGYRTECFFLGTDDATERSIDRILYARGISGVILSVPVREGRTSLELSWERYTAVTISQEWRFLEMNRVSSDHRYNLHRAYAELVGRGYARIGLSLPPSGIDPKGCDWLGPYLATVHHFPRSRQMPVFFGSTKTAPLKSFRSWYEKWRPDALLCLLGEELEWMQAMGLSPLKEMGLVCLNRPLGSKFSGIEENNALVGDLACAVVVNHLRGNELGLPEHPQRILVEGTWVEGKTLPAMKQKTGRKKKA